MRRVPGEILGTQAATMPSYILHEMSTAHNQ